MSLSIIVPTIGRPSLRKTIRSIAEQTEHNDEVLIVSDTAHPDLKVMELALTLDGRKGNWCYAYAGNGAPLGFYGHRVRNHALDVSLIHGTHLWTIDDDDVLLPGGLALIREACCDVPVVFKMQFGPGSHAQGVTCWRYKLIVLGDVGTPMIVAPICKARFGLDYLGDFAYVKALVNELGDPIWREEIVVEVRPV